MRVMNTVAAACLAVLMFFSHSGASSADGYGEGVRGDIGGESGVAAALADENVWFFDRNMKRVVLDVVDDRITVIFGAGLGDEKTVEKHARMFAEKMVRVVEAVYDPNIRVNACFLRLEEGIGKDERVALATEIASMAYVDAVFPVLRMDDRLFVFFDNVAVKWKSGVSDEEKTRLMDGLYLLPGDSEDRLRKDLHRGDYFRAVNLLAEDVTTVHAEPVLTRLEPTILAALHVDMPGGDIGDPIAFMLTVRFSDRIKLDPGALVNPDLRPADLQQELFDLHIDPHDAFRTPASGSIRITGHVVFYTPGDHLLPSVDILYTCVDCPGEPVRTFSTRPVPIRIASIIPPVRTALKMMLSPDPPEMGGDPGTYRKRARLYEYAGVVLLGLGLAVFTRGIFRMLRMQGRSTENESPIPLETHREALERYLETKSDQTTLANWIQVSGLLRAYLVHTYHPPVYPSGGSGARFMDAVGSVLPGTVRDAARGIFKRIDEAVAAEELSRVDPAEIEIGIGTILHDNDSDPS